MSTDLFADRMAVIRTRFVSKLFAKLVAIDEALPHLTGEESTAVAAVATAYRRIHDVCGVGPTVGFPETGRAARTIDAVLVGPFRAERGLNAVELTSLREGLIALRAAIALDMQSTAGEEKAAANGARN